MFITNIRTDNSLLFTGQGFALIIYQTTSHHEHPSGSIDGVSGVYLRTLDTYPAGLLMFNYKQYGSMPADIQLPESAPHSEEYAKRLLSKSSRNAFKVRITK